MIVDKETALQIAGFLLQIKAIIIQPDKPFTWASGWKSPVYCDNRKTLSYTHIRTFIRQQLTSAIDKHFGKPDVIAGVATGGIAQGALVAEELGVPYIYVRSKNKDHGLGNLIEGVVHSGQSVILIEDLISTGKSSLNAVEAVRDAACTVKGLASIFTYGFEIAEEEFRSHHCPAVSLCDFNVLLKIAVETNYISERDVAILQAWHTNPGDWKY